MSRYRKLDDGSYISEYETTNTLLHTENNTVVSPMSPVSHQGIPSLLSLTSAKNFMSSGQSARDNTTTYGPSSNGYASLRYYGDGVY